MWLKMKQCHCFAKFFIKNSITFSINFLVGVGVMNNGRILLSHHLFLRHLEIWFPSSKLSCHSKRLVLNQNINRLNLKIKIKTHQATSCMKYYSPCTRDMKNCQNKLLIFTFPWNHFIKMPILAVDVFALNQFRWFLYV